MNNKLILFFREFFLSFDFIVFLISMLVVIINKLDIEFFEIFYRFILTDNKILSISIIVVFHVSILFYCIKAYNMILFPDDKFNKILIEFEFYDELKITALVSILEPVIAILIMLYLLIFDLQTIITNKAILILGLVFYSLVDSITTFFAQNKIKESLYKFDPYE